MIRSDLSGIGLIVLLLLAPVRAANKDDANDPSKADASFAIQGEYSGDLAAPGGGDKVKTGVQIISHGHSKYHAVIYGGGLPGDGWDGKTKVEGDNRPEQGVVFIIGDRTGTVWDGKITIGNDKADNLGELKHVVRESPTLGAKPPEGAIVLFDGSNADAWDGGKMTEDKLLIQGPTSKKKFQDFTLHVEFRLPFMPEAGGQGRGNSGVYLQGRYEIQVLDSFGLKGENNECGGIYTIKAPLVNMCFPPLSWQTYDVEYTAAKYEGDKKVKNAVATVKHNGVLVHDATEIPHATTAAPVKEGPEPGPIYLQDHGNPVRYRNVWIVEKKP